MGATGTVERIYDLKAVGADALVQQLNLINLKFEQIRQSKAALNSLDKLNPDELAKYNAEMEKLSKQQKENTNDAERLTKQLEKLKTADAERLAALKLSIQEQQKANKQAAILAEAEEGSIQQKKILLSQLTAEYQKMSASERASSGGQDLMSRTNALNTELKQLDATIGNHQRNVGNYTGALRTLESALLEVNSKIEANKNANNGDADSMGKLMKEQELLTQIVNRQTKGFANIQMEIRSTQQSMATLSAEGLKDSKAFQDLTATLADAQRELKEFKDTQKLFSAELPGVAAASIAAKGLAGIYAVGAGAAAMFADGNEKVEKELQKLVAVMTVLQGLQEVHELLEKRGAIATIASTVASRIAAGAQKIWTATMMESTAATVAFRTALALTTGGVLLLLPLIASGFSKIAESQHKAAEENKLYNDALKKAGENLGEEYGRLELIRTVLESDNVSRTKKLEIIKKTREEFPEVLKGLSDEQALHEQGLTAIDKYTDGLKRKAIVQASLSLISDAYKKELEAEAMTADDALNKTDAFINRILKNPLSLAGAGPVLTGSEIAADINDAQSSKQKAIDNAKKGVEDVLKAVKDKVADGSITIDDIITGKGGKGKEDATKKLLEDFKNFKLKLDEIGSGTNSASDKRAKVEAEYQALLAELKKYYAAHLLTDKQFQDDLAKIEGKRKRDGIAAGDDIELADTRKTEAEKTKIAAKADEDRMLNTIAKQDEAYGKSADAFLKAEERKTAAHKTMLALREQAEKAVADAGLQIAVDRIKHDSDERLKSLDKNRERELSNKHLTEAQKKAVNDKYDRLKYQETVKEFNREKLMDESRLAMEGAILFIKSMVAAGGYPIGLGAAALSVIPTAAQMAIIAAKQPPTFALGGDPLQVGGMFGGNSHSSGGNKYVMNNYRAIETEANEISIINKNSAASNRIFSAMGTAKQIASALNVSGGGVEFAPGARISSFDYNGSLGSSVKPPVYSSYIGGASNGFSDVNDTLSLAMKAVVSLNNRIDNLQVVLNPHAVTKSQVDYAKSVAISTL